MDGQTMDMVLKPHAPIVNLYISFHFRSIRVRTRNCGTISVFSSASAGDEKRLEEKWQRALPISPRWLIHKSKCQTSSSCFVLCLNLSYWHFSASDHDPQNMHSFSVSLPSPQSRRSLPGPNQTECLIPLSALTFLPILSVAASLA